MFKVNLILEVVSTLVWGVRPDTSSRNNVYTWTNPVSEIPIMSSTANQNLESVWYHTDVQSKQKQGILMIWVAFLSLSQINVSFLLSL